MAANEKATETNRFRHLTGVSLAVSRVVLSALPVAGSLYVLDIHSYARKALFKEQYLGLFLGLALAGVFLNVPAYKNEPRSRVPWYDVILALFGGAIGLYLVVAYPRILNEIGYATLDKVVLGTVAVVLVLEASRRMTGWTLVILAAIFILYARFGALFPGIFETRSTSWPRLATYLYLDTNSLLGIPLTIAGTIGLAFIFFGQMLFRTGGGRFLTEVSMAALGRYRGGPAKMAVVASSLFGTISGGVTANIFTTGTVTIPLMKRTGYKPYVAGAIEAVASTGGMLMPPVMGIVAFLIADFLSIPYVSVVTAALIPAVLYYIALFVQVDLEAAKSGLTGLPRSDLPSLRNVLRLGWLFIVPLVVLIYTLFVLNFHPSKAGIAGMFSVLILSFLRKETRPGPAQLISMLEETGLAVLDIAMITAAVGFVIGVLFLTGLGFSFSLALVNLGGGNLLGLLALAAVTSIILGMGMPPAAVYILLAVLIAPALTQLGIEPLAAHLFIFYFGMLSMITPPVCIGAFAGAVLAQASPMRTGLEGVRFGVIAYLLPFLFVLSPALLMEGSPVTIILATVTAMIGAGLLGASFTGFLLKPLGWLKRIILAAGAIALLVPPGGGIQFSWPINLGGLALTALVVGREWLHRARSRA